MIDLRNVEVVKYSMPESGTYETTQTLLRGQMLESSAVEGLRLSVDILLQLATK